MPLSLPAVVGIGANSNGTTSCSPGYVPGSIAGDLILLGVINKYPTNSPATPSGWTLGTQISGGHGSAGADAGNIYVTVYWKVADGTETGVQLVTVASGNCTTGRIIQLRATEGAYFVTPIFCSAAQGTPGTSWAAQASATVDARLGDMVVVISGHNAQGFSNTLEAVTIPGFTLGNETEQADTGSGMGDHCRIIVSTHNVLTGVGQAVTPSYTMTASGSTADAPAGGTIWCILRQTGTRNVPIARPVIVIRRNSRSRALRTRRGRSTEEAMREERARSF